MFNLSTEKKLEIIAGIAIFLSFFMLMKLGLDMHLVTEWRMNGERAKANAFLLNRGAVLVLFLTISMTAICIAEKLKAQKACEEGEEAEAENA